MQTTNKLPYLVLLLGILLTLLMPGCGNKDNKKVLEFDKIEDSFMASRAMGSYFEVYKDGAWKKIFVKGVNIGTALPGNWYTDFPANRELYRSWLEDIAAMNANTVRLYTLLDPSFYQVFHEFNSDPSNPRIWLLQEIWPHDDVPGLNLHYLSYKEAYKKEVGLVVDALHGNAEIPGRPHRAYGFYSADVSPYLLGLLIGREFEPDEVKATNEANVELNKYLGNYVVVNDASPTEVWIAEMCDYTMNYAQDNYDWQHPVGFVSWPTLDPLTHPSEWESKSISASPAYNDREKIRPQVFHAGLQNRAGFFGAYHIYPNYPDFMNNEPRFSNFSDEEGVFRYKGYLHDFMEIHPAYPALVAEFGISTSLNTAHFNPDGLNHGGLSEIDQGKMIVRMLKSIKNEGYAGGIIFEWADEWAKKTWNTEPYMVPWERHNLWKNAMDPEQNYGILSMEPARKPFQGSEYRLQSFDTQPLSANSSQKALIKSLIVDTDEAFLYLAVEFENVSNKESRELLWDEFGLVIGINTGIKDAGDFKLPIEGIPILPAGVNFMLEIDSPADAYLLVVPSYNRGEYRFSPETSQKGIFNHIKPVVNRERITLDGRVFPALRDNQSKLSYGQFNTEKNDYYSLSHWYAEPEFGRILIRLPWMLLNVSDPSSGMIINDDRKFLKDPHRDQLRVEKTDGFLFYAATYKDKDSSIDQSVKPRVLDFQPRQGEIFAKQSPYLWNYWEEPFYTSRIKKSYQIITNYFGQE